MTPYLVIFAAVLIGSVVGPYNDWTCRGQLTVEPDSLTAGECKWFVDDTDEDDECTGASDGCPGASECAAALCGTDCDCPCDHKCYNGCQQGEDGLGLFEKAAGDSTAEEDNWCDHLTTETLEFSGKENEECDDGVCGSCGEPWCAQLDVRESHHVPTDGMCGRGIETYDDDKNRICTKNIRETCDAPWGGYDYLLGDYDCELSCGYPFKCNNELRAFEPVNQITAFKDLCTDRGAGFALKKGACEHQDRPPQCRSDNDYANDGYSHRPTHVISWTVLRVANSLCDDNCGLLEARYSWGDCAHGSHPPGWNDSQVCFVAVDHYGFDIGSCGLGDAGVRVHECNGDGKDICKCPEPEDYVTDYQPPAKKYPTPTPTYKPETYEPEYPEKVYYDEANADAQPASASTYTVLSVAGIALAHVML